MHSTLLLTNFEGVEPHTKKTGAPYIFPHRDYGDYDNPQSLQALFPGDPRLCEVGN